MSSNSSGTGGVGFFGLLTIAFIVLKLIGAIEWSWWWVLSPLWIPVTAVIVTYLLIVIIAIALTE